MISIHRQPEDTWVVTHQLMTEELYITAFDDRFERLIPVEIEVIDDQTVVLRFEYEVMGFAILSTASMVEINHDPVSWRIRHGYNRKEIMYQVRSIDNKVVYEDESYIQDNNTLYVNGTDTGSKVFIKSGIAVGDSVDFDGDGVDDGVISNDVWVFDNVSKITSNYNYDGNDWIAWVIDHPYPINVFQVSCYDDNNMRIEPAQVLLNELDINNEPQLVVLWELSSRGNVNDYLGFAAISPVGDLVSFSGLVPISPVGEMLPVEYRLTIETDDEIYTFLPEGHRDLVSLFAGTEKEIYYYDYSNPSDKNFIHG